jgi:pSer/pThr/pTyr-binding forkhead associated (FHA) protein
MSESMNPESEGSRLETVSLSKETGSTINLGKNGPGIDIIPDPETESGLRAVDSFGAEHPLHEGANYIGRSNECDIVINVPNVSRKHAVIRVAEHEYHISDLDSLNGTFLA